MVTIRFLAVFTAFAAALFSTACNSETQGETTPSPTQFVGTSTVPATETTATLETARASSPPTTLAPVDGITSTQVNVRAEPSTAGNVLGIIPADMRVEITGRDPAGNWWQINYPHPEAIDGKGWVTAQFVTMPNIVEVPVIGGPQADPDGGAVALIQQQLNVRSGPGTDFN